MQKVLMLEAYDCNDPLWDHIIKILKEHDPEFITVTYEIGNYMNFHFNTPSKKREK